MLAAANIGRRAITDLLNNCKVVIFIYLSLANFGIYRELSAHVKMKI